MNGKDDRSTDESRAATLKALRAAMTEVLERPPSTSTTRSGETSSSGPGPRFPTRSTEPLGSTASPGSTARKRAAFPEPSDEERPEGDRLFPEGALASRSRSKKAHRGDDASDAADMAPGSGQKKSRRRNERDAAEEALDEDPRARKKQEPDPSKLTEDSLREAALRYLDRYDASVTQLRRVLDRRVKKYAGPNDFAEARRRIDEILERFVASALLDDARYARTFVTSARAKGSSSMKIQAKLRARGVSSELTDTSLRAARDDHGQDDLSAARAFTKKKRLTTRFDLKDPAQKNRALATLARQGFSFDVAKRALALESNDDAF